jgi:hypothetical protein
MAENKGSSDESIGRPKQWREGRYQQPGKPVDESVTTPAGEKDRSSDPVSTPVTQKDYQQRKALPIDPVLSHWNVGYASH